MTTVFSTFTGNIPRFIDTGVADRQSLASVAIAMDQGWESIFDLLIEWATNPDTVADDDEGIIAPSGSVIAAASRMASWLRDVGMTKPQRTITDGSGGVIFEWMGDDYLQSVRIGADQNAEMLVFVGTRLVDRFPLPSIARE